MKPAIDSKLFISRLGEHYRNEECHLHWDKKNVWTLLFAVIMSAQCTDKRVNMVTPKLFQEFPDLESFVAKPIELLETEIRSTGFYKNKAKSLKGSAEAILLKHKGQVPDTMEELILLPGVGRKTANVVLWNAFGKNVGFVVDTHVLKITNRTGLISKQNISKANNQRLTTKDYDKNPERVEKKLMKIFPQDQWGNLSHQMVQFGRDHCTAPTPKCSGCFFQDICPKVGITKWK